MIDEKRGNPYHDRRGRFTGHGVDGGTEIPKPELTWTKPHSGGYDAEGERFRYVVRREGRNQWRLSIHDPMTLQTYHHYDTSDPRAIAERYERSSPEEQRRLRDDFRAGKAPKERARPMLTKNTTAVKVKAGPEDGLAEGEFIVYPSTFTREPDAVNDVVAPGAFLKSLENWKASGNVLPGLYGHRTDDPDFYVAGAIDTGEDEHGWWVKGAFDMDSPKGPTVYRLVKGRRLNQLSFAYDVIDQAEVELKSGQKANELRELEVYEFSFVPVGANQDTGVVAVKSIIENVERELKAGRTLSAKNESALRGAYDSIGNVLDSLDPAEEKRGNPYHDRRGRFSHGVDGGTEIPADTGDGSDLTVGDRVSHVAAPGSHGTVTREVGPEHVEVTWDPEHGEPADTELIHRGDLKPHPKNAGKASGNDPSRHTPAPPAGRGANLSPSVATALLEVDLALSV